MPAELNLRFPGPSEVIVTFGNAGTDTLPFVNPFTPKDHAAIRWYIETYAAHALGDPDDAEAARVRTLLPAIGKRIFDAVFQNRSAWRLFDRFQTTRDSGPRLLTVTAAHPSVTGLPWELLNPDGKDGGFLFWETPRVSVRRRVAGAGDGQESFETEAKETLRLLFVVSRPEGSGFIDPRTDPMAVMDALEKHAPGRVDCEFLRPPTLEALVERLEDQSLPPVDILHFDGHGVFDERGGLPSRHHAAGNRGARAEGAGSGGGGGNQSVHFRGAGAAPPFDEPPGTGYLLFEDAAGGCDFVSADRFGRNLNRHRVSLVVLSACQSAMTGTAEDLGKEDGAAPQMGSVAARLTETGIPAVLAMTHSVLVATTRALFGRMYGELARHKPLGEALDNARRHLFDHPGKYEVPRGKERRTLKLHDWFLPALYQPGDDRALLTAPPPNAQPTAPAKALSNLPPAPEAGFFGRRRELWRIETGFTRGARRITISGFGGQGKTALALEAGRWLCRTGMFRAAVFVDYFLDRSEDAVQAAVNAAGFVLDRTFASAEEVTKALDAAPTLLILDNLEVLSDTALRALLEAAVSWSEAGQSRVLLTTRRPEFNHSKYPKEGNRAHRVIVLEGLGNAGYPDDALEWFSALHGRSPGRVPPEREGLVNLLSEVGFHPLSIRVLAAQLKTRSLASVGVDLERLLAGAEVREHVNLDDDTPAALLASLLVSLNQLDEASRTLVNRLGVFQGGGFEDNLLAVTGLGQAGTEAGETLWPRLKAELERAVLVTAEHVPGVSYPFLRFHPTLAPLLCSRLELDERRRFETAHRERYGLLAHWMYQQDSKAPDQVRAIARRELPNLLYACRGALEAGEPGAVNFTDSLNRFLNFFGLQREAEALLERARKLEETSPGKVESSPDLFLARSGEGERLYAAGRPGMARSVFEDVLLGLKAEPSYDRAFTLAWIGRCLESEGAPVAAAERLQQALAILKALEQTDYVKRLQGGCFTELGDCFKGAGRYVQAREQYAEGLKIARELEDLRQQGVINSQFGSLALQEGKLKEAVERYLAALELFERLGELGAVAATHNQLGLTLHKARLLDDAERHYREAARISESQGDLLGAAETWNNLAIVTGQAGRPEAAEGWYRKALAHMANPVDRARALNNLAVLLSQLPGRLTEAKRLAGEALIIKKTLDPAAAEIWGTFGILANITAIEARETADPVKRVELEAEAAAHLRAARETFRAFPGGRVRLRQYGPLVAAAISALYGDTEARAALAQHQAAMREAGGRWVSLSAALDRLSTGERNTEILCAELIFEHAGIMDMILEGLADPEALREFLSSGNEELKGGDD